MERDFNPYISCFNSYVAHPGGNTPLNPMAIPFVDHADTDPNEFNNTTSSNSDSDSYSDSYFLGDSDYSDSAYDTLHNLRIKNVDKIIIGHININSIRNKFTLHADLITRKVNILLISETKIDSSFLLFLPLSLRQNKQRRRPNAIH